MTNANRRHHDPTRTTPRLRPRDRKRRGSLGGVGAVIVLALLAGLVASRPAAAQQQPGAMPITPGRIAAAPNAYAGQLVTLIDEINQTLGPQALILTGAEGATADDLLVVGAEPLAQIAGLPAGGALAAGDLVQITGTVRWFKLADVERELGVDLDDGLFRNFEGRPALIARSMVPGAGAPRSDGTSVPATPATVGRILTHPDSYLGGSVRVIDAVNQVLTPQAFVLDPDPATSGDELLVVGNQPLAQLAGLPAGSGFASGDLVLVVGNVRTFKLADVERELGIDLDDNAFRAWEGKPAIVPISIVPSRPISIGPAGAPGALPSLVAPPVPQGQIALIPPGTPIAVVAVDEITDSPDQYFGRTVTVSNEIDRILSPQAFILDEDSPLFEDDLLVLTSKPIESLLGLPAGATLARNERVLATGTVRAFRIADSEREFGVDLDDNAFREWEGKPALVASALTRLFRPAAITSHLDAWLNQPVAIYGDVDEVIAPEALTLEGRGTLIGQELLVVAPRPLRDLALWPIETRLIGDIPIAVSGTLRTFRIADFEREFGVDLDDGLYLNWEGRPALVASSWLRLPPLPLQ